MFKLIKSKNDSNLSTEYWNLKQKQETPKLTWEIKGQYKAYNSTLKKKKPLLEWKVSDYRWSRQIFTKQEVGSDLSIPPQKQV